MLKTELRLIDIYNPNTPFIPNLVGVEQIQLYEAVMNNYMWAYLEADCYEQFAVKFKAYWHRLMPHYELLYKQQLKFLENLEYFRKEKYERNRTETDTPNVDVETTYTLGDKTELQHGRVLTHTRDLSDSSEEANYDAPVVERTGTLGGEETNAYSGTDVTERSGENVEHRRETGTRTNVHSDTTNTSVEMYDAERFAAGVRVANIINKFIDEFAPLFVPIIF